MKSPLRFTSLLALVAGLFLSPPVAFAQSGAVTVQFKVFALTGNFSGLGFKSGGATTGLSVTGQGSDGKSYSYSGPSSMELVRGNTAVGKVNFRGNGSYIVYLMGADDNTVAGGAVSSDTKDFPLGAYRILNVSSYDMLVEISGKRAKLPAGGSLMLPTIPPPAKGESITVLKFLLASNPDADLSHLAVQPDKTGRNTAVIMCTNETQAKQKKGEPNFNVATVRDDGGAAKSGAPSSSSSSSKGSSKSPSPAGNNYNNGGNRQRRGN